MGRVKWWREQYGQVMHTNIPSEPLNSDVSNDLRIIWEVGYVAGQGGNPEYNWRTKELTGVDGSGNAQY